MSIDSKERTAEMSAQAESLVLPVDELPHHARHSPRRRLLTAGSFTVLVVGLLGILQQATLSTLPIVIVLAAAIAFMLAAGRLRENPLRALLVAVNVAVVLAYVWSLGERAHVVIHVTPGSAIASVDGNTAVLHRLPGTGPISLYNRSSIPTVGGPVASTASPPFWNALTSLGSLVGLDDPGPAWTNVHLISHGRSTDLTGTGIGTTRWINRRGELEMAAGTRWPLATTPRGSYTISADLMRSVGTQGILFGGGHGHRGTLFAVQIDGRLAGWLRWHRGPKGALVHGWKVALPNVTPTFDVSQRAMLQRILRFLLPSVILATILAFLVVPFSMLFSVPFLLLPRRRPVIPTTWLSKWRVRQTIALLGAVLLGVGGVIAAGFLSKVVFLGVPNVQDSLAYMFQAKTLALGRLWLPVPTHPIFFWEEWILTYHHHWFGKYPPGWPALLSIGVLLHKPWLVNPVLFGISVVLVYAIGREVYGTVVGLLAAALAVTSPVLIFVAGVYLSHMAEVCVLLSFAYLVIRYHRHTVGTGATWSWRRAALYMTAAGAFLGFAFLIRDLDALAFALPFLVLLLRRPRSLGWLMVGGGIPALAYLRYNQQLTGDPFINTYALAYNWDRIGFGPTVGGPSAYNANYNFARALWNTGRDAQLLQIHLFGWPGFFALALVALPFVLGRVRRWDILFAATALCVMVAYLAYWSPDGWYGMPRYYSAAVPFLAILAARGIVELSQFPRRLRLPMLPIGTVAAPIALLLLLWGYALTFYSPPEVMGFVQWNLHNRDPIIAVERAHLHHAVVFQAQRGGNDWWPYGALFLANAPNVHGDVVYVRNMGCLDAPFMQNYPGRAAYFMLGMTLTRFTPRPCRA